MNQLSLQKGSIVKNGRLSPKMEFHGLLRRNLDINMVGRVVLIVSDTVFEDKDRDV